MKQLTIKKLNLNHLDDMVALQKRINDDLGEDEKHFILPKSRKDFYKALTSNDTHIIGVFDENKLVAQSTLVLPENGKDRELSEYAENYDNSEIAIYKTILVDPNHEYRGHGLMKTMLEFMEAAKEVKEKKLAIIQIATDNPASWISAMKHGMQITKVGNDPEDNAEVLYLEKKLDGSKDFSINYNDGFSLKLGSDIHKNAPILFNKMCKISENRVGGKWDKNTNSIIWYARNNINSMNMIKEIANVKQI